jgi:hypothetical protein
MRKKFPLFILIGPLIVAAVTALVMVIWNYAMPAIFGLPAINFWQTLALLFLSKVFFTSFHGGRNTDMHFKKKRIEHWRKEFDEKLCNMDPEDREMFMAAKKRFQQHWKGRMNWSDCGEDFGREDFKRGAKRPEKDSSEAKEE